MLMCKFKVNVKVSDDGGDSIFVLFDNDMTFLFGKSCGKLVASVKVCHEIFPCSILKCVCSYILMIMFFL